MAVFTIIKVMRKAKHQIRTKLILIDIANFDLFSPSSDRQVITREMEKEKQGTGIELYKSMSMPK